MKNKLDLIFKKDKRAKMESRYVVEVTKSFDEANKVLETMQFEEGIKCLQTYVNISLSNQTRNKYT